MSTIDHWVAGKPSALASTRTAPVYDPATGRQSGEVLLASKADVDQAVAAARQAEFGPLP